MPHHNCPEPPSDNELLRQIVRDVEVIAGLARMAIVLVLNVAGAGAVKWLGMLQ